MIILHKNEIGISTKFVEAVGITMPSYTLPEEHNEGPGGICPENFVWILTLHATVIRVGLIGKTGYQLHMKTAWDWSLG